MSPKRKTTNSETKESDAMIPPVVIHLAQVNGIDPQELLDWKTYPCGKVTLIAANGMKFVHVGEHEPNA